MKKNSIISTVRSYLSIVNMGLSFAWLAFSVVSLLFYMGYRSYIGDMIKKYNMTADEMKGSMYEVTGDQIISIIFAIIVIASGIFSIIALRNKIMGKKVKHPITLSSIGAQVLSGILLAIVFYGFISTQKENLPTFRFPLNIQFMTFIGQDSMSWVISMVAAGAVITAVLASAEMALSFIDKGEGAENAAPASSDALAKAAAPSFAAPAADAIKPVDTAAPVEPAAPAEPAASIESATPAEPIAPEVAPVDAPTDPVASADPIAAPADESTIASATDSAASAPTNPVASVDPIASGSDTSTDPIASVDPIASAPAEPATPVDSIASTDTPTDPMATPTI